MKEPKAGDIRYFCFYTPYNKNEVLIQKVQIIRKWWDKTNNIYVWNCKVLENIYGEHGKKVTVDHEWQLRESLEDSYKIFFIAIFSKRGEEAFYYEDYNA